MDQELKKKVFASLKIATVENGYSFDGWSAFNIAWDLIMFNSDFEKMEPEEILPYVEAWQLETVQAIAPTQENTNV